MRAGTWVWLRAACDALVAVVAALSILALHPAGRPERRAWRDPGWRTPGSCRASLRRCRAAYARQQAGADLRRDRMNPDAAGRPGREELPACGPGDLSVTVRWEREGGGLRGQVIAENAGRRACR